MYQEPVRETIALFGGTFAPPHNGHVHAVEALLEALDVDRVLIMPTATPPHKEKAAGDTPALRLAMCEAAFGHLSKTEVSSYEIDKGGVSYTVETLEHLTRPGRRIILVCGTDMFLTLAKWMRAKRIFDLADIVCIPRYDADRAELDAHKAAYERDYGARVTILSTEVLELSSTDIRTHIAGGDILTPYLPAAVEAIIRREGLYR